MAFRCGPIVATLAGQFSATRLRELAIARGESLVRGGGAGFFFASTAGKKKPRSPGGNRGFGFLLGETNVMGGNTITYLMYARRPEKTTIRGERR